MNKPFEVPGNPKAGWLSWIPTASRVDDDGAKLDGDELLSWCGQTGCPCGATNQSHATAPSPATVPVPQSGYVIICGLWSRDEKRNDVEVWNGASNRRSFKILLSLLARCYVGASLVGLALFLWQAPAPTQKIHCGNFHVELKRLLKRFVSPESVYLKSFTTLKTTFVSCVFLDHNNNCLNYPEFNQPAIAYIKQSCGR